MIKFIESDDLISKIYDYDAIVLLMNISNSTSNGILKDISINFSDFNEKEIKTGYGDTRKYGTVKKIECDDGVVFYILYCIKNNVINIDLLSNALDNLRDILEKKGNNFKIAIENTDISPNISPSGEIHTLFSKYFSESRHLIVFFKKNEETFNLRYYHKFKELKLKYKSGNLTKKEYNIEKNKLYWEKNYGIYKKMPEGWEYKNKKSIFV